MPFEQSTILTPIHSPDKRRSVNGNKNYALMELKNIHFEMARLLALGLKHVDVAKQLGVSPQTISNAANTPIMQRTIARLQIKRNQDVEEHNPTKRIDEMVGKAIDAMEDILDGVADPKLANTQLSTANSILDRSTKVGPVPRNVNIRKEAPASQYIEELRKMAIEQGIIEEAEIIELESDNTATKTINREALKLEK